MIFFNKYDEILFNISKIIEKRIRRDVDITLKIDTEMDEFSGKIEGSVITAGSYAMLLEIAGRFIRKDNISDGAVYSHKKFCGIYLATHNKNYYELAPIDELLEYLDDLALWGMNVLMLWYATRHYKKVDEGLELAERYKTIFRHMKSIGIKTAMCILANEPLSETPKELLADWTAGHDGYIRNLNAHYHLEICPSVPGGMEKILEIRRDYCELFKDAPIDYFQISGYDQGGCTCGKCAPWGSNGFLRACEAIVPLLKEYFPKAEIILNLWLFGQFRDDNEAEIAGVKQALLDGRFKECTYINAEQEYLRYPFENIMPRPLIGFPEISMTKTIPWGGYGTNPIPSFLQKLWDKGGDKLEGGTPYCEGFYEDINKIIMLRLYRENMRAEDSIREYLRYEFGLENEMLSRVQKAVMAMEETLYRDFEPGHRYPVKNPDKIPMIEEIILEADKTLPEEIRNGKKWQAIYLRAIIDGELYRNDFKRNEKVMQYFMKLIKLYYLENTIFNLKPDIVEDEKYGRVLTKEELKIIAAGGRLD